MGKRLAPECLDEAGEMPEVLLRIRIRPPHPRIGAKRQGQDRNDGIGIGCRGGDDRGGGHKYPPSTSTRQRELWTAREGNDERQEAQQRTACSGDMRILRQCRASWSTSSCMWMTRGTKTPKAV